MAITLFISLCFPSFRLTLCALRSYCAVQHRLSPLVCWCRDGLVSKTQHIQEGFHRLFCLVPYDIISAELWNHIMPNWLEAILQDVPEDELPELKIILRLGPDEPRSLSNG